MVTTLIVVGIFGLFILFMTLITPAKREDTNA